MARDVRWPKFNWEIPVKIVGSTFYGLTLGCAQCHDYRYDSIPFTACCGRLSLRSGEVDAAIGDNRDGHPENYYDRGTRHAGHH